MEHVTLRLPVCTVKDVRARLCKYNMTVESEMEHEMAILFLQARKFLGQTETEPLMLLQSSQQR